MRGISHLSLFDQISKLRALAAALHDKATLLGTKAEDSAKELEPIRDLMNQLVQGDAHLNPERVAAAIRGFHNQKLSMLEMAKEFDMKANDASIHEENLKLALLREMQRRGVDYLEAGGFLISRIRLEGGETILVR